MATDLHLALRALVRRAIARIISRERLGDSAWFWGLYRMLRKMPDNCNLRMTYDRGELEIMSPSAEHEGIATLLGNLVTVWCMERKIPLRSCRTLTIRRSVLKRGFEPDNCYYVQNEPKFGISESLTLRSIRHPTWPLRLKSRASY